MLCIEEHGDAVQLLLQTGATSPNVYADALRACLIAALKMPDQIESTIKVTGRACVFQRGLLTMAWRALDP